MSRNGSGVYSLPPGSIIANGETSDATDLNVPLQDIEADLNVARPIAAGGTGATSAQAARANLGIASYDNVAAVIAASDAFDPDTIIVTSEEGFSYKAVASSGDVVNAGGQNFEVLPSDGGYNVASFGFKGDGSSGDTALANKAIAAAESDSNSAGGVVLFPSGEFEITEPLVISKRYVNLIGNGQFSTNITYSGASGKFNAITTASMPFFRGSIKGMSIKGDATSGRAIDFSNVSDQVYNAEFSDLFLDAGDEAFYCPNGMFSSDIRNVQGGSESKHVFHARCGPGVIWLNVLANSVGTAGKAGYRLAGAINMMGCNGLIGGDIWGVFGNDLSSGDGYEGDFDAIDYPSILLDGCNIEKFGTISSAGCGIRVQQAVRSFEVRGGKIDRGGITDDYSSLLYFAKNPFSTGLIAKLGFSIVFPPTGTALDGQIRSPAANFVEDTYGTFAGQGVTVATNGSGVEYPLLRNYGTSDVAEEWSYYVSDMTARRMSLQMTRYEIATLTPEGVDQTIDVTGHDKVVVTPPSATSVLTASFTQSSSSADNGRNGRLIIEAGNADLTLKHSASGNRRFDLGGSDLEMGSGDVVELQFSTTRGMWVKPL